jgi:hypothetical protein
MLQKIIVKQGKGSVLQSGPQNKESITYIGFYYPRQIIMSKGLFVSLPAYNPARLYNPNYII